MKEGEKETLKRIRSTNNVLMKTVMQAIFIIIISSCSVKKQIGNAQDELDCQSAITIFEKELLSSCPISKGAEEVVEYLEKIPGFYRNKNYDFGNGSIRFNAENGSIYGYPVLKDKSVFLLNYLPNLSGYESWYLFQAIYFFEKKEDKDAVLNKMIRVITEDLNLENKLNSTLSNPPYTRYHLPCGSGFNFKHRDFEDKYIIDILWVRDITK